MEGRRKKKERAVRNRKRCVLFFAVMTVFTCFSGKAWAAPESAYPAQKWATLRDNVLEYDELPDLIHEYNKTVINQRLEYEEYRGKDHDDLKNAYQDLADQMYENSDRLMDSVNEDDDGYGSIAAQAQLLRIQAEQNQEMADSQNEDGIIKGLELKRQEALLVKEAQEKMIAYWQKEWKRPSLEASCSLAKAQYEAAQVRFQAGMLSQTGLLKSQGEMENAQAEKALNEKEQKELLGELCVMTGWKYDASPDVCLVPVPEPSVVDEISLEEDLKKAVEENYIQRANERRLKYTDGDGQLEIMEKKVENGEELIRADVTEKYQLLTKARDEYQQAEIQWQLAKEQYQADQTRFLQGMLSMNQWTEKQGELTEKEGKKQTAALQFSQAFEAYRWTVRGLAEAE